VIQRLRPIENRLRDDHRLRKAESLIGRRSFSVTRRKIFK